MIGVLFEHGIFTPQALDDERTADVLRAAADRAAARVRPSDILSAAIAGGDPKVLSALSATLDEGVRLHDVLDSIEAYNPARQSGLELDEFDGTRERFSPETLEALSEFEEALSADQERLREVGLELLLTCVLSHLEARDREMLRILDAEHAVKVLGEQVRVVSEPLAPLFDIASGRLRSEEFSETAWAALERAATRAAELGYDRILPPHGFLALLEETEGLAEHLVRLQAPPEVGPARVANAVADSFRLADHRQRPLELHRDSVGEAFVSMLRRAQRAARLWGAERIDTPHLLVALLDEMPARLASILEREPLRLSLAKLRGHLERALRDARMTAPREVAFRLPADVLPSEDLTWRARTGGVLRALHLDRYFDPLTRALYRTTNNHVIITGPRGVGTTTLVRELARRAAAGEIPFLERKRLLWVDCREISAAESSDKLGRVISHVAGRTDLILCLDGLGAVLRGESSTDPKLLLRSALKERRIHLVGVMASHEYEDLLSADHALLEFLTRVDVAEPDQEASLAMAQQAAASLSEEFGLAIAARAVERTVVLSADYILNERLPLKAVKILRRACEDLDYERSQQGSGRAEVGTEDVIRVISEITGLPEERLSGAVTERIDYEESLGEAVVGQEDAVAAVSAELRLIKAGLTTPGKPAAVLFFAGLTGVGKTELAKALARFYSASKRLQTYSMTIFTQPHAVSGIIGVPPGYVGYEQGGRLINDLNADPYCVFLLDEAEKAHPDIWKPFLNLFDEGWVVDQRGVKAFGDRAIFILTSNAGHDIIARMSRAGEPMRAIAAEVKAYLPDVRHKQSGEAVFPPEFLARIKRIIIFKPLDQQAMEGICRILLAQRQKFWLEKREKRLVVPDALIRYIASQSHAENEGGTEGGRVVGKKISELIEVAIQREAERQPDSFRSCNRVELLFFPPGPRLPGHPPPAPRIDVALHADGVPSQQVEVEQAGGGAP